MSRMISLHRHDPYVSNLRLPGWLIPVLFIPCKDLGMGGPSVCHFELSKFMIRLSGRSHRVMRKSGGLNVFNLCMHADANNKSKISSLGDGFEMFLGPSFAIS